MHVKSLISDQAGPSCRYKLSMGRVSFWIAFALAIYLGVSKGDVPTGVQWLLGTLLAYVAAAKAIHHKAPLDPPEVGK